MCPLLNDFSSTHYNGYFSVKMTIQILSIGNIYKIKIYTFLFLICSAQITMLKTHHMLRTRILGFHLKQRHNPSMPVLAASVTSANKKRVFSTRSGQPTKAVIFDMGGVLLPSPANTFNGMSCSSIHIGFRC